MNLILDVESQNDASMWGLCSPRTYSLIPFGSMLECWTRLRLCAQVGKKAGERVTVEGIEVALNPEELDLDTAAMQAKYEQTVREQQSQLEKEDLSDMVAEHAAKQQKVVAGFYSI